jgi:ubiquitin-conjugating enzyme E2 J2
MAGKVRLQREFAMLQKEPVELLIARPTEKDIFVWHYVLQGPSGTPFQGGVYHGQLLFPKTYPMAPPGVVMLTPSGRFEPGHRICMSMTDYHPESWNPAWNVRAILLGLVSFLVDKEVTAGSIVTDDETKRRLAKESAGYNLSDKHFVAIFPEYAEQLKKAQEAAAAKAAAKGAGAGGDGDGDGDRDVDEGEGKGGKVKKSKEEKAAEKAAKKAAKEAKRAATAAEEKQKGRDDEGGAGAGGAVDSAGAGAGAGEKEARDGTEP